MYFRQFPLVYYKFGSNEPISLFQNISVYVDLIDQIVDQVNYYEKYTIKENERPDSLSHILYGDDQFYWTFFLLNQHLRESGWPLTTQEFDKYIKTAYPYFTVTTQKDISSSAFKPGATVTGNDTGNTGVIKEVNLELGQLVIDTRGFVTLKTDDPEYEIYPVLEEAETLRKYVDLASAPFFKSNYEVVSIIGAHETDPNSLNKPPNVREKMRLDGNKLYIKDDQSLTTGVTSLFISFNYRFFRNLNFNPTESVTFGTRGTDLVDAPLIKAVEQHNSIAYYENTDGDRVDIFSASTGLPDYSLTTSLIPQTYKDRAELRNQELKQIKILKPGVVERVAQEFNKLLET